jgi:LacI family transcriptional regulator
LASQTSGNIGFIVTQDHFSQAEPFYTKIFLGTEIEARNHKYYVLLTTVSKTYKANHSIPRFLLERNVDGVILAGKINEKLSDYIQSKDIPVVLIDYVFKHSKTSAVLIDNFQGAHLAVNHLIECGRKRIAFVGGDLEHPSIAERLTGYRDTLQKKGIIPDKHLLAVDEDDTRVRNGFSAAQKLLEQGGNPDAIFAANDAMAMGCMQFLKKRGVRIPDDIAIVGFDDVEMCSHIEPHLTTIRVFKEEMGAIAVQRMVEMIQKKDAAVNITYVPVELVVRDSCGGKRTTISEQVDESILTAA